jgi:hypothetical protein
VGVKEKVLGTHLAGANEVIVTWANRKDVEPDVPKEVRARMQFAFARAVRSALDAAFEEGTLLWRTLAPVVGEQAISRMYPSRAHVHDATPNSPPPCTSPSL